MLDDAALDRLVAEVNPEEETRDEIEAAWARLLASQHPRRALPRPSVLVPALASCVAAVTFAAVNWLPASDPGALSAAYAKRIAHGEHALGAGAGRVLYVEMTSTDTGLGGTQHFVTRNWQSRTGAYRSFGIASGPGTSNTVTDVSFLGGVGAYYVPATHTLHVNHPPAGDSGPSAAPFGSEPSADPVSAALLAVLTAKADHGSAHANTVPGVFRDLTRLPGARISKSHGLETVSVTNGRFQSQMIVRSGSLRPVSINMRYPAPSDKSVAAVVRIRFTHYEYLSASVGARQIDLLDAYPNAKIVVSHNSTLKVP